MARGRMLSQTIALDLALNQMSLEAQFLFMRAIPHLDRDGLVLGNAVALWAKVAPLLPELMPKTETAIREWIAADLVILYESPYGPVLFFKGFNKNQSNLRYEREAESLFPPPPGYYRNGHGLEPLPATATPPTTPIPTAPVQPVSLPDECPQEEKKPAEQLRQESGKSPAEVRQESRPIEVKLSKSKSSYAHACEAEPETLLAAAAAALPDPEKRKTFVQEYERVWALTLTPYLAEKVSEWSERVAERAWSFALQECANNRKVGNWRYLESILRRVEVEGIPQTPEPVPRNQTTNGSGSVLPITALPRADPLPAHVIAARERYKQANGLAM